MRALAGVASGMLFLAGCGGAAHSTRTIAPRDDISALQAVQNVPMRNGATGAPIEGLTVSGTITNTDTSLLRCRANAFLLIAPSGAAIAPSLQWCDVPAIAPDHSAEFTATFVTPAHQNLQLRFEHPNGTYETHNVILPPQ